MKLRERRAAPIPAPAAANIFIYKRSEQMKYVTYDQLPLMLNAEDVQHVMNISRAGAYQLMHREDFPTILVGKRMVVPRDKFLNG